MARYADKAKKKVPVPRSARDIALCRRLNIPVEKLQEPKFRKAVDHYFAEVRKILSEPIDLPTEFKNPPGAVQGSRVANRFCDKKVIPDSHGVR